MRRMLVRHGVACITTPACMYTLMHALHVPRVQRVGKGMHRLRIAACLCWTSTYTACTTQADLLNLSSKPSNLIREPNQTNLNAVLPTCSTAAPHLSLFHLLPCPSQKLQLRLSRPQLTLCIQNPQRPLLGNHTLCCECLTALSQPGAHLAEALWCRGYADGERGLLSL